MLRPPAHPYLFDMGAPCVLPSRRPSSASRRAIITLEAPLDQSFFARDVHDVARDLLGVTFLVDGVGGVLVEVEAYAPDDPASHSYRGRTARNAAMFGPPGT